MKKIGDKKLDHEEFMYRCLNTHGNSYRYGLYKNWHSKVDIFCENHGVFQLTPDSHIKNRKICPKCEVEIKIIDWVDRCNKFHNFKYDYSKVDFITSNNYVLISCPTHGEFRQQSRMHPFQGCPKCAKNTRLTTKEFIELSRRVHNSVYDYTDAIYINNHTKVKLICRKHGGFETIPNLHLNRRQGCPFCKASKGELTICYILDRYEIKYIRQYKFDSCKNKYKLPFDFYLPSENLCIEFDGVQHFESLEFFGGEIALEKQKYNDLIKDKYCLDNKISLIRIPYYEENNIENIIIKNVINEAQ